MEKIEKLETAKTRDFCEIKNIIDEGWKDQDQWKKQAEQILGKNTLLDRAGELCQLPQYTEKSDDSPLWKNSENPHLFPRKISPQ